MAPPCNILPPPLLSARKSKKTAPYHLHRTPPHHPPTTYANPQPAKHNLPCEEK
ncbi:predicted protein [Plenodomus lingam JN3]|uniref:Predicted protein n=1 Tax=Leptosphaeria maculans (strain JN3 / isolate v23.1.3 / race Av1-4-5-6-7-8) TaxID=985895 RepID=E5R5E5_LEPMJ|nr:predicted protein [Plenodomus lingam JN3]CBX92115.1 predicted protein [Plenodomus lingam JN3]